MPGRHTLLLSSKQKSRLQEFKCIRRATFIYRVWHVASLKPYKFICRNLHQSQSFPAKAAVAKMQVIHRVSRRRTTTEFSWFLHHTFGCAFQLAVREMTVRLVILLWGLSWASKRVTFHNRIELYIKTKYFRNIWCFLNDAKINNSPFTNSVYLAMIAFFK